MSLRNAQPQMGHLYITTPPSKAQKPLKKGRSIVRARGWRGQSTAVFPIRQGRCIEEFTAPTGFVQVHIPALGSGL